MKLKIDDLKVDAGDKSTRLATLTADLESVTMSDPSLTKELLASSSIGDSAGEHLTEGMRDVFKSTASSMEALQLDPQELNIAAMAGAIGYVIAEDPTMILDTKPKFADAESDLFRGTIDANVSRSYSRECYVHSNNASVKECSCDFNKQAIRGDEFVRVMAPMVLIGPQDKGLRCSISLIYIQQDALHSISGDIFDLQRKSLVRAAIDSSILEGSDNELVPLYRDPESMDKFVPADMVAPWSVVEGGTDLTSFLATNTDVDLIGISRTDMNEKHGPANLSYMLDAATKLKTILVGIGEYTPADADPASYEKYLEIDTSGFSTALLYPSHVGKTADSTLNLDTANIRLTGDTLFTDGSTLAALATVPADYQIFVRAHVVGTTNVETSNTNYAGATWEISAIYDADGTLVPETDENYIRIAGFIEGVDGTEPGQGCRILGYQASARLTNQNHADRGLLIGSDTYMEEMAVGVQAPITCARNANDEITQDQIDIIVTALHTRMNNKCVRKLHQSFAQVKAWGTNPIPGRVPDQFGIGRLVVTPVAVERELDVHAEIMGLSSSTRINDLRSVVSNAIRSAVMRAWTTSGMRSARMGLGITGKPHVSIGMSEYLEGWIMEEGITNMLGDKFDYTIVSSPNSEMTDDIFFGFNQLGSGDTPKCLNTWHTAYSPEIIMNANIQRGDAYGKETAVFPRFETFDVCPVMGHLSVTNIEQSLGAIANGL